MNDEDRHAPGLVGGLLAMACCYLDALGSLAGCESRVWRRVDADTGREGR